MTRALFYLVVSGSVWLAEGFIFSQLLEFKAWQTVLLAGLYLALLGVAAAWLYRLLRENDPSGTDLATWRYLSLAPMLTTVLGSFMSLPIVLSVLALGKLG